MNENSVSSKDFTIFFSPAQLCAHCERWAFIGYAEREKRSLRVMPLCHEHGYFDVAQHATPEEHRNQRSSIERFVVWASGCAGIAKVVRTIAPSKVPGYDFDEHYEDGYQARAWIVRYTLEGEDTEVYVVYDHVDWKLSLYVDGKRVILQ